MPTASDLMTPAPRTCSTFSTVLEAVMPIPDGFAPDLYLSNLVALEGNVATIDEPIGRYRLHSANKHLVPGRVGIDWLDMKLHERKLIDDEVRARASALGLTSGPHDYIRAGLEVAHRRLTRQSGATKWALEGIRSIATHPQFRLRSRAKHIAWFAGTAVAPPSVARRLSLQRYPLARDSDVKLQSS
jgi:hypothetical protein